MPGVFPLVIHNGDLLVDGGLINNVPIDAMRKRIGEGIVIAVDVSPEKDLRGNEDYGAGVSGWRALRRKIAPDRTHAPVRTLPQVLPRSLEIGGQAYRQRDTGQADLYIRIPLEKFKANDFAAGPEIAEEGYRYSRPILEEWRHS